MALPPVMARGRRIAALAMEGELAADGFGCAIPQEVAGEHNMLPAHR